MKTTEKKRVEFKEDLFSIIIASISLSFMLTVYSPLELYLSNQDEFWFDIYTIFPSIIILFLVFSLSNIIVLYIERRLNLRFFQFGIILETILYLLLYIQGNFMVKNLPALDGRYIDWSGFTKERICTIFLLVIISLVVFFFIKVFSLSNIIKYSNYFFCGVTLILVITLMTLCISSNGFNKKTQISVTNKNIMKMSSECNFIILLLDATDSKNFTQFIDESSQYKETFSDFTYFPDTMGGYPLTDRSIPFILSGMWYENKEPFNEYKNKVCGKSELFETLENEQYEMNVYETEFVAQNTAKRFKNMISKTEISSYFELAVKEFKISLFKYMPFDFKKFFVVYTEDFDDLKKSIDGYEQYKLDNYNLLNCLQNTKIDVCEEKQFKFIHLDGAHPPFKHDENLEVSDNAKYEDKYKGALKLADMYLQEMKDSNIYDNSVVIIMSDHGYSSTYHQTPLFMVKGINEKNDIMEVSSIPFSYEDLIKVYKGLLDGKKSEIAVSEANVHNSNRRFLSFNYLLEEYMKEYIQTGYAWNDETMKATGNEYNYNSEACSVRVFKDSLDNYEKIDEEFGGSLDYVRTISDGNYSITGWAIDAEEKNPAKDVLAEIDGVLYESNKCFREDVSIIYDDSREYGYKFVLTGDIEGKVIKLYFITTENKVYKPRIVKILENSFEYVG